MLSKLITLCATKEFNPVTLRKKKIYALKIHYHVFMFKISYLIFGRINSSESIIDTEILRVLSPKHFTFYIFLKGQNSQKRQYKYQIDTVIQKYLGSVWERHPQPMCLYACAGFLSNFQEDWRENSLPYILNPLRSDKILQSKVGCCVILILEMSSCATGSRDGNATFIPNPTCVCHPGGPRAGRS